VEIIAWASDSELDSGVPNLPLNSPEIVAQFIVDTLLERPHTRQVTGLLAATGSIPTSQILAYAEVLENVGIEDIMVVRPPGSPMLPLHRTVHDIRPGLGPLGALLTGLAASTTTAVLFMSASREPPPEQFLRGILEWGPTQADVVVPTLNRRRMPLPGLYGHRCLSAIQESLLSGEGRLDGWWAQVRVHGIPEEQWRAANPEGIALER